MLLLVATMAFLTVAILNILTLKLRQWIRANKNMSTMFYEAKWIQAFQWLNRNQNVYFY